MYLTTRIEAFRHRQRCDLFVDIGKKKVVNSRDVKRDCEFEYAMANLALLENNLSEMWKVRFGHDYK